MRVDKRPGSGVAKIHVEDDGSYFQVSQVSASLVGLKHVSLLRRVTNAGATGPCTSHQSFLRYVLQRALCRDGSSRIPSLSPSLSEL